MRPNQETHMSREKREETNKHLDWVDLNIARAAEVKHVIKRVENNIELDRQEELDLNGARQFLRQRNDSPSFHNSLVLPRSSFAIEQAGSQLERLKEDHSVRVDRAEIHLKVAEELLQGMETPTDFVKKSNLRVVEATGRLKDELKFSQEFKVIQSPRPGLFTDNQREEK